MTRAPVAVRPLEADEWELLRHLRLAALVDSPLAFASSLEREAAFDEKTWRARIETSRYFVATCGEHAVGIACLIPAHEPDADAQGSPVFVRTDLELVSMWVEPTSRRRGVGAALAAAARSHAEKEGATGVVLWVAEGNEAAASFYRSLGFTATSGRQRLPRSDDRCETQLRLPLPPPES